MKCKQCGASVPLDAQTCPSCGANITSHVTDLESAPSSQASEHANTHSIENTDVQLAKLLGNMREADSRIGTEPQSDSYTAEHALIDDQEFNPFFGEDQLTITKGENPTEEIIQLAFPEGRQPTLPEGGELLEDDDVRLSFLAVSDDSAQALNAPVDLYGESAYRRARHSNASRKHSIAPALIALLLVAAAGAAFFVLVLPKLSYASQPQSTESRGRTTDNAKQANAPVEASVTLQITVPGLDANGSRVPVHVVGATIEDESVDATYYIEADGTGLTLLSGEYTAQLAGSPISAEGALYALPGEEAKVSVSVSAAGVPEVTQQTPWDLAELPKEQTTEEVIEQARLLVQADPLRKDLADELANRARERAGLLETEPEATESAPTQTTNNNYNSYNTYNDYSNYGSGSYSGGGTTGYTDYNTDDGTNTGDNGDSGTGEVVNPPAGGGDDSGSGSESGSGGGDDSGGDDTTTSEGSNTK